MSLKSVLNLSKNELKKQSSTITVEDVKADVVALYFSAHWCPPCRGFTPVFAELYKEMKAAGKAFEVIFCSSDKEAGQFQSYYDSMPWLALPYEMRAEKEALSNQFGVRGIPSLVLIDGKSGEVISKDGRSLVTEHGVAGFPFSKARLAELALEKEKLQAEALADWKIFPDVSAQLKAAEVVLLFMGTGDSRPVNMLKGPVLETYKELKGSKLEVVWVATNPSDTFGDSLPFCKPKVDAAGLATLDRLFGAKARGFCLVVIKGGKVLVEDAGQQVFETKAAGYPWSVEALAAAAKVKKVAAAEFQKKSKNLEFLSAVGPLLKGAGNVDLKTVAANDVVGLYFSAHWCPPCRAFTPQMAKQYEQLVSAGKKIEIIFCSSDRDEGSFKDYFASMPWAALPYKERALKEILSEAYEVEGIPTLVLLDPKTGETITTEGTSVALKGVEAFPYRPADIARVTSK